MGEEEETNGEEEEMKGEEEETMGEDEETKTGEPQTEVAASANEPVTYLQGNPMFKMKGSSKLDWEYVPHVAKKGADVSSIKSHDAINAFCLLCCESITYSKGNRNSVYHHNMLKHKKKLNDLKLNKEQQVKKTKVNSSIPAYFSSMLKEENTKMASKDDQNL
jgi:hypothetical protein